MARKTDDIKMMVTKDRKTQMTIIGVGVFLVIGLMVFLTSADKYKTKRMTTTRTSTKTVTPKDEHLDDFVKSFKSDLTQLQKDQVEAQKEMKELGNRLDVYERRTSDIFKKILEKVAEIEVGSGGNG